MSSKYKTILFYDFACRTKKEKREFQRFNKGIKKLGFMMIQKSVYVRSIKSKEEYANIKARIMIRENNNNDIRIVLLTNSKYEEIEMISGQETLTDMVLTSKKNVINL